MGKNTKKLRQIEQRFHFLAVVNIYNKVAIHFRDEKTNYTYIFILVNSVIYEPGVWWSLV